MQKNRQSRGVKNAGGEADWDNESAEAEAGLDRDPRKAMVEVIPQQLQRRSGFPHTLPMVFIALRTSQIIPGNTR